ncbi:hypothetical protein IE81DRAFT_341331 [Ceraceosorus guamensis]|uniref:Uncharacterized protein n=1 Tax=Ceraceosorus guamensis TaxID=1522189 RepID=A0A316VY70_9BASI|nr:hypothetical protein IE81DRAFT_341331 [Ceraceosorus guamensis]PWN42607.1 hypothetical protein IE81DRAFT_341331 [Ceraceosorus guamensis]
MNSFRPSGLVGPAPSDPAPSDPSVFCNEAIEAQLQLKASPVGSEVDELLQSPPASPKPSVIRTKSAPIIAVNDVRSSLVKQSESASIASPTNIIQGASESATTVTNGAAPLDQHSLVSLRNQIDAREQSSVRRHREIVKLLRSSTAEHSKPLGTRADTKASSSIGPIDAKPFPALSSQATPHTNGVIDAFRAQPSIRISILTLFDSSSISLCISRSDAPCPTPGSTSAPDGGLPALVPSDTLISALRLTYGFILDQGGLLGTSKGALAVNGIPSGYTTITSGGLATSTHSNSMGRYPIAENDGDMTQTAVCAPSNSMGRHPIAENDGDMTQTAVCAPEATSKDWASPLKPKVKRKSATPSRIDRKVQQNAALSNTQSRKRTKGSITIDTKQAAAIACDQHAKTCTADGAESFAPAVFSQQTHGVTVRPPWAQEAISNIVAPRSAPPTRTAPATNFVLPSFNPFERNGPSPSANLANDQSVTAAQACATSLPAADLDASQRAHSDLEGVLEAHNFRAMPPDQKIELLFLISTRRGLDQQLAEAVDQRARLVDEKNAAQRQLSQYVKLKHTKKRCASCLLCQGMQDTRHFRHSRRVALRTSFEKQGYSN